MSKSVFGDILDKFLESPQAAPGNLSISKDIEFLTVVTQPDKKHYDFYEEIDGYVLCGYLSTPHNSELPIGKLFIQVGKLGTREDHRAGDLCLNVVFEVSAILTELENYSKNVYQVKDVKTARAYQRQGIATIAYKYAIHKLGLIIMSDFTQFDGARMLYSKLSKDPSIQCDLYDLDREEVILKDCHVEHGREFYDFDQNVWSWDTSKRNTMILLKQK